MRGERGVHGKGRGACVAGGACMAERMHDRGACMAGETATGMHSCLKKIDSIY